MSLIAFDNSYARLPPRFFSEREPTPVTAPGPIAVNRALAETLGIDPNWLESEEGTSVLAGNTLAPGSEPIATVYAGHQFGSYNPQLGDGRAILLGEVVTNDGTRYDIQLKGAGPTPYSRGGDGRAPLGAVLREYIVSEAMHALGVPTTRALAAVTTGDKVTRESFLPGAVLTRVAKSHIRIGTFQFFAASGDNDALQALTNHVLERHYPEALDSDNRPLALLEKVVTAQASLIAQWQLLGFIHGVMNTDNMLLSGETIDYGPCAFIDHFNPEKVFSSIDHGGRYAYRNQPGIAHWNLAVLAQALLPIIHDEQEQAVALAQSAVDTFPAQFLDAHAAGMAAKLGLGSVEDEDKSLVEDLLELMTREKADFTLTFRRLADHAGDSSEGPQSVGRLFEFSDAFIPWLGRWQSRLQAESIEPAQRQQQMYRTNPVFIPRNHLVEEALEAASEEGDFGPFRQLAVVLSSPYTFDDSLIRFATPPRPEQEVTKTFCGT
ncbi:MAG: YdiU family protein [Pseudomonadota bacterium]